MNYWVAAAIAGFYLIQVMWKTYSHPSSVLGRQGANMNWVYVGRVSDEDGYKNAKVARGFLEAIISYKNGNVILTAPPIGKEFDDFIELEKWLAVGLKAAETKTEGDIEAFIQMDGS